MKPGGFKLWVSTDFSLYSPPPASYVNVAQSSNAPMALISVCHSSSTQGTL
jgi:hypothetical protein